MQEGYMNNCIDIFISKPKQRYLGILYNRTRYSPNSRRVFLEQVYEAAEFLDSEGIPSRTPRRTRDGTHITSLKLASENTTRPFGLYSYLPGDTLPWEAYTRRHLRSLGKTMAAIHKIWEDYNGNSSHIPTWKKYLDLDHSKLSRYLSGNAPTILRKLSLTVDISKLNDLAERLSHLPEKGQLIHYDLVRGNVLFSKEKKTDIYPVTGILDFEKVMLAPVSIDIARTLSFLLVDCRYKTDAEIYRYFRDEGYGIQADRGIGGIDNRSPAVIYFWLRDLWKFLSANPYESLEQNFHFKRTVERLSENGFVKKIT
jgi:thiamine kinase-like enzyme